MEARYWVVDFLIMSKIPMKILIQESDSLVYKITRMAFTGKIIQMLYG